MAGSAHTLTGEKPSFRDLRKFPPEFLTDGFDQDPGCLFDFIQSNSERWRDPQGRGSKKEPVSKDPIFKTARDHLLIGFKRIEFDGQPQTATPDLFYLGMSDHFQEDLFLLFYLRHQFFIE